MSRSLPRLEELSLLTPRDWDRCSNAFPIPAFVSAALAFSQGCRQLKLSVGDGIDIKALFAPFWDGDFDSESPPPLTWPHLTRLEVSSLKLASAPDNNDEAIKHMLVVVKRALVQMPSLRHLKLMFRTERYEDEYVLYRPDRGEPAQLAIHYMMDSSRPNGGRPSDEMVKAWRDSLVHTVASLEVHVRADAEVRRLVREALR